MQPPSHKKDIFPESFPELDAGMHPFLKRKRRPGLFHFTLLGFMVIGIALPLIKVEVFTSARGLIKPIKDKIPIRSIVSGQVQWNGIKNNRQVKALDTLLILESKDGFPEIQLLEERMRETTLILEDIQRLLGSSTPHYREMGSSVYREKVKLYETGLRHLQLNHRKHQNELARNSRLFRKGVISRNDFENFNYLEEVARNEVLHFQQNFKARLQDERQAVLQEVSAGSGRRAELKAQRSHHIITAPLAGTLISSELYEGGSFINAGAELAQLLPRSILIAECYVRPRDIGFLQKGNLVSFHIDTYDPHEWGRASGRILEIDAEAVFMEQRPLYKIQCELRQKYLRLKTGIKGPLKNGMTLNARIKLTERSLFQLLFDKLDDWFNPSSQMN